MKDTIGKISSRYGVTETEVCEFIGRPVQYFSQQLTRPGKNRTREQALNQYRATALGLMQLKLAEVH
jgi:hypothetical protein